MRPPLRGSWWREGIWEARECSNLDGRGRPSSTEVFLEMADRSVRTASGAALRRTAEGGCPHVRVFLMADRSAEQRAELRSAGQPRAAVPTWFRVAGGEFGSTPVLEPRRAGRPSSIEV